MKAIGFIVFILMSAAYISCAQLGFHGDNEGISLITFQQPGVNMATQLNQIAHSGSQENQHILNITTPKIEWGSGYNHNATLGFFCKFEDLISNKSRFQINLGLTGD